MCSCGPKSVIFVAHHHMVCQVKQIIVTIHEDHFIGLLKFGEMTNFCNNNDTWWMGGMTERKEPLCFFLQVGDYTGMATTEEERSRRIGICYCIWMKTTRH